MKSTSIRHFALSLFALFALFALSSQFALSQTAPAPNQPIELPEFIVTGKESVNIPGGAKRDPVRPPILRSDKLDSLNPVEKLPLPRIPAKQLPQYTRDDRYIPGYLQVEFGNYLTPMMMAGYSLRSDGYLIDIRGALEASSGWVDKSEYFTGSVGATSTYVAPEKFLVLGGSTTLVDVDLGHRSYNLYSVANPAARTATAFGAGVNTTGTYESVDYDALISWKHIAMSTNSVDVGDDVFRGFLSLEKHWTEISAGGLVDVRLRTYNEKSYPFTNLAAVGGYRGGSMTLRGTAGAQWVGTTAGDDRFGALVEASIDMGLSKDVTVSATVNSGLQPHSFDEALTTNPYVSDSVVIDAPYNIFDARGSLMIHPSIRFTASAGVRVKQTDRDVVWMPSSSGTFVIDYRTSSMFSLFGDLRWLASSHDVVVADIVFTNATVSGGEQKPYVPSIQASAGYDRTWSERFNTVATLVYVGDRWADIANDVVLTGYIDLRLAATYSISENIKLNARASNLVGSTIVLWQGYRERGIFISGGLTITF